MPRPFRTGCPTAEAVSVLGNASTDGVECDPVAAAGSAADSTCRGTCRAVALAITDDASARCVDCSAGGLAPEAGLALSLFGDASTSCSGDCRDTRYVAVSGTGRADGEHAVSGCETGETVGTGIACARTGGA